MWSRTRSSILPVFIAGLMLLFLSGCGFQLRGKATLPPGLEKMTITGLDMYDQLVVVVSQYLRANGVDVVANGDPQAAVLRLSNFSQTKEIIVVAVDGTVREYRLISGVTMELNDKATGLKLPPERVQVMRDFLYNPDDVLGKSEEEKVLREEMIRDLGRKIMERLGTLGS